MVSDVGTTECPNRAGLPSAANAEVAASTPAIVPSIVLRVMKMDPPGGGWMGPGHGTCGVASRGKPGEGTMDYSECPGSPRWSFPTGAAAPRLRADGRATGHGTSAQSLPPLTSLVSYS